MSPPAEPSRGPMSLLIERFVDEAGGADPIAAERFVRARVAAMPEVPRAGVRAVEALLVARLRLARDGAALADAWTRSSLPGVAEYVRLVRSLAVVYAYDGSATSAA